VKVIAPVNPVDGGSVPESLELFSHHPSAQAGYDIAGIVEKTGRKSQFKPGDSVYGISV
jgi:NADPH:quinone reductase-like Zn-dependent oxidoreductase